MQNLENDMEDLFKSAGENYSPQKGIGDWESILKQISDKPSAIKPIRYNRNWEFIVYFLLILNISVDLFMLTNTTIEKSYLANHNALSIQANNTPRKAEIKNNYADIPMDYAALDYFSAKNKVDKKRIKKQAFSVNGLTNIASINRATLYFKNNNQTSQKEKSKNHYKNFNGYSKNELSENLMFKTNKLEQSKSVNIKSIVEDNSSPMKKKKETILILQKKNGLYFGLLAATDFSKGKSTSFNKAGFDAGIIAGLRVNSKLSFETGLIWNNKIYSSKGKYFNINKVRSTMPPGMKINNLESKNSLIEIPMKVKYDFAHKRTVDFFIEAGVSSYIMTIEKNLYNVTMNSSHENILGIYTENNYRFPAVANFSIGFEHSISKNANIRIEPFLKVPLQGLGVGNLHVTGAGLQIGITSRLK